MQRVIVHLDADAFFASVEQAADPRLRGKPVAVGGEKRGIIASASYEARRMGIYTPMPTALARKICPNLIILPGDFDKYEQFSRWMFSYAQDFTPDVEITSIDEGYFDLTSTRKPPVEVAETIRRAIRESLKISVSEGIATNKLVSQIACKLKKPSAFARVSPGMEKKFLEPLPVRWLPGIGPQTETRLHSAGLTLIGKVAETPVELLQLILGSQAYQIKEFANGIDERPVVPVSAPAKSYSKQETFEEDLTDEEYADAVVRRMVDHLMAAVRSEGKAIRTIAVKVRYNDMEEESCSESLDEPTNIETDVYNVASRLLRRAWRRRVSLRMISVKFSNVYDAVFYCELPLNPGVSTSENLRRLSEAIDNLRRIYGERAVMRGHDLRLQSKPHQVTSQNLSSMSSGKKAALQTIRVIVSPNRSKTAFVPLCVHSYYSFLQSTLSPKEIVTLAARHGLPAVALTDNANLHGAVEFYQEAKKTGIKPIIGAEIFIDGKPAWLYAENATGYANLCKLLSEKTGNRKRKPFAEEIFNASPDETLEETDFQRYYTKREFELEEIANLSSGIIAVSANESLREIFAERFYRAVLREEAWKIHQFDKNERNRCIAVFPIHYAEKSHRWKFNVIQSIRTRTLLGQRHPEKLGEGDFHFPSTTEAAEWYKTAPFLLENSIGIAERCNFEFQIGRLHLPRYSPPDGSTPTEFLRKLVMEGLRFRYGKKADGVRPQIEEELKIIAEVGYEEYFLAVWDLLQECKRRGIEWLTRGSAADSLVCYCLGISDICPIRFNLYFRRFLNRERMAFNKLPDIDIDFPHDRKDDVINIIFEKYGAEHAAVVGGFSTFQARSAAADIGKVLGLSEQQVRQITANFPWGGARGLAESIQKLSECKDLPLDEEPYKSAIEMAEFLDGFPRYPKMHPCGIVISPVPVHALTPTFISAKGYPTTHLDMDSLEAVGLVKMDILAQGGLAVMRDTMTSLKKEGIEINLKSLEPWKDESVWDMISSGETRAVHHIESPAMVGLCRMSNVRDIDGLVALVSVIRPGAANEQKKIRFARRYQGLEKPTYAHPLLEPILKETYGLVVYEEHVLQICEQFAGLSPGRADTMRRALGKGKPELVKEVAQEFIESARRLGRSEKEIADVLDLLLGFSGYAFCKAHSAAYAVEAYQSAWLKRYYPAHFMAAVLSNGKGFYDPLVYILECHRLGIKLLPPWINQPGPDFDICNDIDAHFPTNENNKSAANHRVTQFPPTMPLPAIRVPAVRAKGLSEKTIRRVLDEHKRGVFKSLEDFVNRVLPEPSEMEILLRIGAFDGFGKTRVEQFWEYQRIRAREYVRGGVQGLLFDQVALENPELPSLEEPSLQQKLEWEFELFGFTVSAHPLALFSDIAWGTYCPIKDLGRYCGETVVCCGLVIEQRLHHQITGEPMKFLTIADWTGIIETELFAQTYKSYGLATVRFPVLEITAVVEPFENKRGFTLRVLKAGKPRKK